MKKIVIGVIAFALYSGMATAQNEKSDLVDAISKKHHWIPSVMVENFVTVNVSPDIWKKMLAEPNRPVGITSFANLGMSISEFLDNTTGTTLNKLCGFGVNDVSRKSNMPICEDQIKEAKGKISITVNAQNLRVTEDSYMLSMKCLTTVREFLDKTKGTNGWKPKAKNISIIVNSGTSEKDLGAKWNADFSAVTITTSPYVEVPGWSDKIMNVLQKGVK